MNHKQTSFPFEFPLPFAADWHHHLRERLSVFPRFIVLPENDGRLEFWPDLATFTDDPYSRLLMYYAPGSRYSICVNYSKATRKWQTVKFEDERVVAKATGESYAQTMSAALVEFGSRDFLQGGEAVSPHPVTAESLAAWPAASLPRERRNAQGFCALFVAAAQSCRSAIMGSIFVARRAGK